MGKRGDRNDKGLEDARGINREKTTAKIGQQMANQVHLVLTGDLIMIFIVTLDVSQHLASFLSETRVWTVSELIALIGPR